MSEFALWCYGIGMVSVGFAAIAVGLAAAQWGTTVQEARREKYLRSLVLAAEQLYGPGKGETKRRYVRERLKQKGLADTVGRDELEACVYECFGDYRKEAGQ